MPRVFVTGLPATMMWKMEEQLGNAAIVIPMFKQLHERIPGLTIRSNMQFSPGFVDEYGVSCTEDPNSFSWTLKATGWSVISFVMVLLAKYLPNPLKNFLIQHAPSPLVREYRQSDAVVEVNGDIYSEYLTNLRFIKHSADLLTIRLLGKPLLSLPNSPGPFHTGWKATVARYVFNQMTVISNREPVSSVLLKQLGVTGTPIISTACTAYILEPASKEAATEFFKAEGVDPTRRPMVGVCMAGANFKNIYQAKGSELSTFVPFLKYLLDETDANVLLTPHVYRTNTTLAEYIHGPDYLILRQMYEAVDGDKYGDRLHLWHSFHTPGGIKSVFRELDLFVSGRMHAAIGAMSQGTPTVMLAYGHKQYGMAHLLEIKDYIYGGKDPQKVVDVVRRGFENRDQLRETLARTSVRAKGYAAINLDIIEDVLKLPEHQRHPIPADVLNRWMQASGQELEASVNLNDVLSDIEVPH